MTNRLKKTESTYRISCSSCSYNILYCSRFTPFLLIEKHHISTTLSLTTAVWDQDQSTPQYESYFYVKSIYFCPHTCNKVSLSCLSLCYRIALEHCKTTWIHHHTRAVYDPCIVRTNDWEGITKSVWMISHWSLREAASFPSVSCLHAIWRVQGEDKTQLPSGNCYNWVIKTNDVKWKRFFFFFILNERSLSPIHTRRYECDSPAPWPWALCSASVFVLQQLLVKDRVVMESQKAYFCT